MCFVSQVTSLDMNKDNLQNPATRFFELIQTKLPTYQTGLVSSFDGKFIQVFIQINIHSAMRVINGSVSFRK